MKPPHAAPAANLAADSPRPPCVIRRWPELAVFALALILLVANLGRGSLVNSDDAIYAEMAREMITGGDWVDLHWHGEVLFEKPPLLFWVVGASGALLGFDDFAVRFPVALFAWGALLLLYSIARRLRLPRAAALTAVVLLLASGCFYFNARRVMTDGPLLFFGLASIDAWLAARTRPRRLLLWGAAVGAAVLTKWVAAGPFVLLALLDGLVERKTSPLWTRWFPLACLLALLVAAPWHILQTLHHGAEFWQIYAGYHVLGRVGSDLVGHADPWFYLRGMWLQEGGLLLLWAIGWLAVLAHGVRTRCSHSVDRWILVWTLVTLIPIHIAHTRLYHYLLPALPALCLATVRLGAALPRPRVVLVSVAFAAGLLLFPANNMGDLLEPDYSAGTRALSGTVRELPEETVLAIVDDYDVAASWYAERPVPHWVTQPELYRRIAVDMMVRAGAVELVSPDELARRLEDARGAFALLTAERIAPTLVFEMRRRGIDVRELARRGRVLLTGGAISRAEPSNVAR